MKIRYCMFLALLLCGAAPSLAQWPANFIKVADSDTIVPTTTQSVGTFNSFGWPALDGDRTVFFGHVSGSWRGMYEQEGIDGVQIVLDWRDVTDTVPPLFWSGQIQTGVSRLVLLGSQGLGWLVEPISRLTGFGKAERESQTRLTLASAALQNSTIELYGKIGLLAVACRFCDSQKHVVRRPFQIDTRQLRQYFLVSSSPGENANVVLEKE